ncbi:hypothetical protein RB201_28050 [Streptomyces sp. S1A(2023)]
MDHALRLTCRWQDPSDRLQSGTDAPEFRGGPAGGVLRSAGLGGKHPKLCGRTGNTGDFTVLVLDGDQVRPTLPAE